MASTSPPSPDGIDIEEKAYYARMAEKRANGDAAAAAEAADPFGRHRWVRLSGLQTTAMNGKLGEVGAI